MQCEMCGRDENLFKAVIEGTQMNVCKKCSSFGKVIARLSEPVYEKSKAPVKAAEEEPEIVQLIVPDYAEKVKKAREATGLKQEELAKKINEKESLIRKVEAGHYEPDIALAKKLEHFLRIVLVEEQTLENGENDAKRPSSEEFTIGDMIKLKK